VLGTVPARIDKVPERVNPTPNFKNTYFKMLLSYNWLKEYIELDVNPHRLAEMLTSAGLKVESVVKQSKPVDYVLDIEVTSNRPDCLSVIGVAREFSALTGKKLNVPATKFKEVDSFTGPPVRVRVEAADKCLRYTARLIDGVTVKVSPPWLKDRLRAVGIRPVNNVVDISNYCLMETGQPFHAFDYDKLEKNEVIVRMAGRGEELVTIDGVSRTLDTSALVIADERGPVALAGIMGGKNTEVTSGTKRILLESACFDPLSIRRTSRKLGLSSESSYRFERGVDLSAVLACSNRASALIAEFCAGRPLKGLVDKGRKKVSGKTITLRPFRLNAILGTKIKTPRMVKILKSLDFEVTPSKQKDRLLVLPPRRRRDVTREIDLIEEVARVYGYERIEATLPRSTVFSYPEDKRQTAKEIIKDCLVASGCFEVLTCTLLSENLLKKVNCGIDKTVRIKNPLTREQEFMRPTLIPGLLGIVSRNRNRNVDDVKIFELGRNYFDSAREQGLTWHPEEKEYLGIAICGQRSQNWQHNAGKLDFFDLKALVELFLGRLGIGKYVFIEKNYAFLSKSASVAISLKEEQIGFLGRLSQKVLDNFSLSGEIYVAEISLEHTFKKADLQRSFSPVSAHPGITRDIAVVVEEGIKSGQLVSIIRNVGRGLITGVRLFDLYHGKQVPPGHKSLAYSIEYRSGNRTLTDAEVDKVHNKVRASLAEKLSAKFR